MAGERQRDGFELDRGRRGVAVFGQRAQQCGRKPECFERHWICCSWKSTPAGNESTHGARAPGREDRWFARSYPRSEEHTSELQSLMRISYAVFCLKQKN